jgi:hypothetical protein
MERRDPSASKTRVALTDGERALRIRVDRKLKVTLILDLIYALEKLWKAAYVFHAEGSLEADLRVMDRTLRILSGGVGQVAQRHPRFEVPDDSRLHVRMLRQIVIQPVGVSIHQRLQPRRARGVLSLQFGRVDEELHPQILVDLPFAFGLGQASHRVQVVRFRPAKVVPRLGIQGSKDRIGVGLPVNVRDAPYRRE